MRLGTTRRLVAGVAVLAIVAVGCGDDDDDDTSTGSENTVQEASSEEYCELARELDEQEDFPTAEQFEALQEAAPDEIREEADTIVPIIVAAIEDGDPFAAFEDPVVEENLEAIEAYEDEECGLCDEDDDEAGAVNPEFEEYCAIAIELNEQEDFPSAEQLEQIREVAPEEISEEIDVVVEAFLAGLEAGDPGAVFEDDEVTSAFGPIEDFDAENCGIDADDGGEDGEEAEQDPSATELDPNAAQVTVTATEYAFAYDPPSAGRTSFTMVNEGEERHVLNIFRVEEGFTFDEVLESEGEEGVGEDLSSDTAAPGEEAVLTMDLEPGEYGMICYLPTPDGTSHIELGMVSSFTVE